MTIDIQTKDKTISVETTYKYNNHLDEKNDTIEIIQAIFKAINVEKS